MRSLIRAAALIAAVFVIAACAQHPTAQPAPTPADHLAQLGIKMPLRLAVRKIAFRPFLPANRIGQIAVIPPLGGEDTPANRGVSVEYRSGSSKLLLSEWPAQKFALTVGQNDLTSHPCAAYAKADGAIWLTLGGLVMTLQADGKGGSSRVFGEAAALIRAGAC
ncbi:MAG: hypothetical protein M3Y21_10360 [Candidatus Eremiobacteraeota bacterium]|nr:hypothetical protein [Candidatus Eremiobacteraeota bacterium]